MRQIIYFLYKLLPYSFRVWSNSKYTEFRAKVLKRPYGRTGPEKSGDRMEERHGKLITGELSFRVIRKGLLGESRSLGRDEFDEGPNTVTDAGVAALVNDWYDASKDVSSFSYIAMGTGGSPPSTPGVGATALVTEVESRTAAVKSKPAANQIRVVGTITATAPRTINEWGLFDQSAVGGTMWSTRWFTAIALASGDAIEFTYTLTISSFTA